MTRLARIGLLLAPLYSASALGAACYVIEESTGPLPDPVVPTKCFYFEDMDDTDAMRWACRDKDDVGQTHRELRQQCPPEPQARCTARMTPETLANEQAFGRRAPGEALPSTLPDGARIVTFYYRITDREQARVDCETLGGDWEQLR